MSNTPVQKTLKNKRADQEMSKSTSSLDDVVTVQPGTKKKGNTVKSHLSFVSLISTHTTSVGSNSKSSTNVKMLNF